MHRQPSKNQTPGRTKQLTVADVTSVLAAGGRVRDRALAYLAVGTGARIGELASLRWADLDLEAGTVRLGVGKRSEAVRVASLDRATSAALKEWLALQPE